MTQSILIKDTTREQREEIVRNSLGDEYYVGCGFEVAHPEERQSGCNLM